MPVKFTPRHRISIRSSRYSPFFAVIVIRIHILLWLQVTVADLLMDGAPPAELDDLRLLAMRVMGLHVAAIHTRYAYFHNDTPSSP